MSRRFWSRLLLQVCLLGAATFFVLPLAWTISTSFKPPTEYYTDNPSLIPQHPTIDHYIATLFPSQTSAIGSGTFAIEEAGSIGSSVILALQNSAMATGLTVIVTLLLSAPMAYSFARSRFRGSRSMGMWILSTRMVPPIASVIPLYVIIRQLGLLDTVPGLVIPYTMANIPFAVWSLKGVFEEIPVELEEAAFVDGASRWVTFFKIVFPLAAGGVVATALLITFLTWGEFIFAAVLTVHDAITLPVALSLFRQDRGILWGGMASTIVIAALPMVLIVFFFQKQLIRGLTTGGLKG